jgi:tRNA 2-selenouridine synthase
VELLKEEYQHFLADPDALGKKLAFLTELHGRERIGRWQEMARQGEWDLLVAELLQQHYDPAYTRSTLKHYPHYAQGLILGPKSLGAEEMLVLAKEILGLTT